MENRKIFKWAIALLVVAMLVATLPMVFAVDPHEHKWGNWEQTSPATCEGSGTERRQCQVSGCSEYETRSINPTGHRFGDWQPHTAATCSSAGKEVRSCQNGCGKTEERTIPQLTHSYVQWGTKTAATCTTDGEEISYCAHGCGTSSTRTVAALGHNYTWRDTKRPTCKDDGEREGKCIRCGDVKKEVIPNFGGKNQANGHSFGSWTEPESNKTATCKQERVRVRTCTNGCGREEVEAIGKGKHVARTNKKGTALWFWQPKPTLEKEGRKVQICKNCNKVMKSVTAKIEGAQYNVPVHGFGPRASTINQMLQGSNDRLIPVDLTATQDQEFALVTDSGYLVGHLVVSVMDGTLSVSYKMNDMDTIVTQSGFMLFPDAKSITPQDLGNVANMRRFGEPIPVGSNTFGVLVARMVINFTTANPLNSAFSESGYYIDGVTSNATVLQEMTANLMQ